MKSLLAKVITFLVVGVMGISTACLPAFALGEDICTKPELQGSAAWEAAGCDESKDELPTLVTNILNAIITVIGLVAVIVIIIGGVNYMTSEGDAGKVQKAKLTILYALIGLIIAVLSFAIVNWVIRKIPF